MSIYYEKARELGELILSSERAIMLADASAEFNKNEDAKRKMEEYNKYQVDVKQSMSSNTLSKDEITVLTRKLTELAVETKSDPYIAALVFAENEFNGFVNQVMNVLKATIMGDEAQAKSCSESEDGCSSCSGCN